MMPEAAFGRLPKAMRGALAKLGADLALWKLRDDKGALRKDTGARPRVAAGEAVRSIDVLLRELHQLRSTLIDEIREFDDEAGRRTDELLAKIRDEHGTPTPLPDEESDDELLDEWHDTGSGPGWSPSSDDTDER